MSTCDVLPNRENNSKTFKNSKKKLPAKHNHNELSNDHPSEENQVSLEQEKVIGPLNHDMEENPACQSLIHVYDKESLLELRSAPVSLCKPDCLDEQFFNKDRVWDPEAWHKSNSSRSASPAVDGKAVVVEGKKIDLINDDIELAPHRRSFKQGCQVQAEKEHKPDWLGKPVFERKNRLTGRAAVHRRSENSVADPNEMLSERAHEFERMRREKFFAMDEKPARFNKRYSDGSLDRNRHDFHKSGLSRERQDSFQNGKISKQNLKEGGKGTHFRRKYENTEEQLPEWMTDGPTSQLDIMEFTGFQDIEEEKKAYMKRKKVRISPDAEDVKDEKQPKNNPTNTKDKDAKSFDINDFFNEVDYYPPRLFGQDTNDEDGIKSRFTQWFQAQHERSHSNSVSSTGGSRPGSANLIPDEVITGPNSGVAYFTPIQPAPVLVTAAASAYAMQTSNISNIIQQQRKEEEEKKANVEVKGRLSLKEIEQDNSTKLDKGTESKSAFDMLVMSMKEAGQLPDKPAPVVSGLPEHLLPQPPKRSSPTFEKLKRSLSRSPSPGQLMNAVATVASLISTTPTLQNDIARSDESTNYLSRTVENPQSENINESYLNESVTQPQSKLLPTAFTPTSVLKKIHNEKQRESPVPSMDMSYVETKKHNTQQNADSVNIGKLKISEDKIKDSILMTPDRSQLIVGTLPFHSAPTTPRNTIDMGVGGTLHSTSLPVTPDHGTNKDERINGQVSMLSPNPVVHLGSAFTPTKTQGEDSSLIAPTSAFQSVRNQKDSQDFGVIGSGIPQRFHQDDHRLPSKLDHARVLADPRLAPGKGARSVGNFNLSRQNDPSLAPGNPLRPSMQSTPQHMPQSQQQQLLHAQRMAQIQRAQLQQQQKLQQIAQQANQQKTMQKQSLHQSKPFSLPSGIGPLLPDPDSVHPQQLRTPAEQRLHQQQQQRQQIQAYQQQQQQQAVVQQAAQNYQRATPFSGNNFRGHPLQGHPNSKISPQIPMPLQQPGLPLHHMQQRPPHNIQNLAAQALAQQHLLNRARFLAQAQLLQQQPQVVQAALMAQAALARGQAQAQAAMMLNPRNLQAMVEQMGIRPSHLNNNKAIPTPLVAQTTSAAVNTQDNVGVTSSASSENVLSKWFTQDILTKIPQNGAPNDLPSGKVLSVEELEKAQRSS